ncbi:copia-type polyprotein [Gossypium australe]|uniref:Copia-type polyprotein n=1 Tax=Gossypium australe TaxID=47621 RepID=A0A5B6VYQ0_9ROSI|nr:copia-type polyprotein [Gossypium australe]
MSIRDPKWRPSLFLKIYRTWWSNDMKSTVKEEQERQLKENIKTDVTTFRIIQQKSTQEAWDVLKKEFKGVDKVISIKLQNYWKIFDNLSMKENESIKDFSLRVVEIGDTIPNKKIVERILRSLSQKFEHIVIVINETKEKSQLTRYKLFISLKAHEDKVNGYTNQPLEQVCHVNANLGKKKSDAKQEQRGSP